MTALPYIEGVNWEVAKGNLPEDDLLVSVVTDFYKKANSEIESLNGFYKAYGETDDDNEIEQYRIKVHAMKNAAAVIGASTLSAQAKALEYASRDREIMTVYEGHENFCENYLKLAQNLAVAFGGDAGAMSGGAFDKETLKDNISELRMAMVETDIEALNDIMDKIISVEYPDALKPFIKQLEDTVLLMDVPRFVETIGSIEKLL